MQLTIDVDKHFIETLKQEFHTANVKDALYQLLDFYKQKEHIHTDLDIEIEKRVRDYKNGSLETNALHDDLDEIRKDLLKYV